MANGLQTCDECTRRYRVHQPNLRTTVIVSHYQPGPHAISEPTCEGNEDG